MPNGALPGGSLQGTMTKEQGPSELVAFQTLMREISQGAYEERQEGEREVLGRQFDPTKVSGGTFKGIIDFAESGRGGDISKMYAAGLGAGMEAIQMKERREMFDIEMAEKRRQFNIQEGRRGAKDVSNNFIAEINRMKKQGKSWGEMADHLAANNVDVSSGSAADNELRRVHGLPPIAAAQSGLTATQKTAVADMDTTIASARDAANIAKGVQTGPIAGRVGKFLQPTGATSDEFVNLNAKIAQLKSEFMKAMAGANVTEPERKRLEAFLPDTTDDEEVLQTKITNFVSELERKKYNLMVQGGGTGEIKVKDKNTGEYGYLPANEFNPDQYEITTISSY